MRASPTTTRDPIFQVILNYIVFVEYIAEGNIELFATPEFKVILKAGGTETSETFFREADVTLEKYPR